MTKGGGTEFGMYDEEEDIHKNFLLKCQNSKSAWKCETKR